jgi:broad specificity phosphatase PhoE
MAQLILIRHGQASLHSSNYDQLSNLGHNQAKILGTYFNNLGITPSRVIRGSLVRHSETADSVIKPLAFDSTVDVDERWNEFDFKVLLKSYINQYHKEPAQFTKQTNPKVFFSILKKAMKAWSSGELDTDELETWDDFSCRISDGLQDISQQSNRNDVIMLASSGGAISMALRHVLGLSVETMIELNFQIKNTSYSSIEIKKDRLVLSSFNQTPHLEVLNDEGMITYA